MVGQKTPRFRKRENVMLCTTTRLTAAVFAAALGLTAIATPASAAPATLTSVGPGTLVADGAAVDVPVTFVCDTDPTLHRAIPLVEVNQRVSQGRIANGFGDKEADCTRAEQTVTVRVIPRLTAFNPGTAVATVYLQTCGADFQCNVVSFNTEIELAQP
jgi:hypothetical protein